MKYLNHFNKHWGRGWGIYLWMRALEQDSFLLLKNRTQTVRWGGRGGASLKKCHSDEFVVNSEKKS